MILENPSQDASLHQIEVETNPDDATSDKGSQISFTSQNSTPSDHDVDQSALGQSKILKKDYSHPDKMTLSKITTGHNTKHAYGIQTRQVNVSRGNREGNNAFLKDTNVQFGDANSEDWSKLIRIISPSHYQIRLSLSENALYDNMLVESIKESLMEANMPLLLHTIEIMDRNGGWGLNKYFLLALTAADPAALGDPKAANVKKKSMGNFVFTPLHCAAVRGHEGIFRKLFEENDDPFLTDAALRKLIHYAAVSEDCGALKVLLDAGTEYRGKDLAKHTPLMLAAKHGRVENVRLLMEKDADGMKTKDGAGNMPIHHAAAGGHSGVIQVLTTEFGQKIDVPGPDRMTALGVATAKGNIDCAKWLLDHGAKPSKRDKFKRTPLMTALMNVQSECAALLLSHGSPFDLQDSSENSAMHYAAAYGCREGVEMLHRVGADPNQLNSWALTPICVAIMKAHLGLVPIFLNFPSINVNCRDDDGCTLITNTCKVLSAENFDYVYRLVHTLVLEKNADVTIKDLQGNLPLHYLLPNIKNCLWGWKSNYDCNEKSFWAGKQNLDR
jgi:ankyrin repeat protein